MYLVESATQQGPPEGFERADRLLTLTMREQQIVRGVVDGSSNRLIAASLGITEQTVKNHLTSVFRKIGVPSRLQLALAVLKREE